MKREIICIFLIACSLALLYYSAVSAGWVEKGAVEDYVGNLFLSLSGKLTGESVFDSDSLNADLVSYYRFSGSAYDVIRKESRPVDIEMDVVEGKKGRAYYFDGEEDFIGLGKPEDILNSLTWSGWAEVLPTDVGRVLYERGGHFKGYQIYLGTDNKVGLRYRWDKSDVSYSICKKEGVIADGNWHFFTAVLDYENEIMRFYVDGVEECHDKITPITTRVDLAAHVGSHGSTAVHLSGYWKGKIDEIGIWSKALTAEQVKELYDSYADEVAVVETEDEEEDLEQEEQESEENVEPEIEGEEKLNFWQRILRAISSKIY